MGLFIIQLLTFAMVSMGSYLAITGFLKLPNTKAVKAAMRVSKLSSKAGKSDLLINEIASRISKVIQFDPYKRKRLEADLRAADIMISPELFRAMTITKTLFVLLFLIPCFAIVPAASILVVIVALVVYFKDENDIHSSVLKKREQIEFELPRFACTLKQELNVSHDVLKILERYSTTAGNAMKKELDITAADMRSSNYEAALIRLETRVSSGSLSDIIRGLISVIRGDDCRSYFEMLSHDLDVLEVQRLEDIASRQPDKIKKYQFLIFACILFLYISVMAVYAYVTIVLQGGIS